MFYKIPNIHGELGELGEIWSCTNIKISSLLMRYMSHLSFTNNNDTFKITLTVITCDFSFRNGSHSHIRNLLFYIITADRIALYICIRTPVTVFLAFQCIFSCAANYNLNPVIKFVYLKTIKKNNQDSS